MHRCCSSVYFAFWNATECIPYGNRRWTIRNHFKLYKEISVVETFRINSNSVQFYSRRKKSYCKQLMEMFWNNVTYECVPIYFLLFTHDELTEKIRLSIESNVEQTISKQKQTFQFVTNLIDRWMDSVILSRLTSSHFSTNSSFPLNQTNYNSKCITNYDIWSVEKHWKLIFSQKRHLICGDDVAATVAVGHNCEAWWDVRSQTIDAGALDKQHYWFRYSNCYLYN